MFILFILGLIIGAIAIVFALQNVAVITVAFFAWQFQASLALIVLLSILVGAIIGALLTIPGAVKNYFMFERLKRRNRELEKDLEAEKREREEAIERISEVALRDHGVKEVHITG